MRTVFMGSPEFAVSSLRVLAQRTEVAAVVCQPDKPAGRGQRLTAPATRRVAEELGLRVMQPAFLRPAKSDFVTELKALRPELIVVVAYGKILPPEVLAVPRLGCWNVHASLLPRYRGAAPIQWALIRGEERTGVTLMQMDAGMDTGPTILMRDLPIAPDDTAGTLHEKLSRLGAELLDEGLAHLLDGTLPQPVPQDDRLATRAPLLSKEHGRVDFTRSAREVCGQIRGVDPWPGAFTTLPGDEIIKLFRPSPSSGSGRPGEILAVDRGGVHIACGPGGKEAVVIAELQLPDRKRLPAQAVLAGLRLPPGMLLGEGRPNPLLQGG